ncbi:hypothetical protein [Erythrobacter sp. HKB08]|uniref:hypothetical protein n=1 Tax=Erythrobacter sp. HKB08 TaxID=2502843 RepID=UPI0010086A8E|nr:hypothetical protein [Erythrobacter sp. HKB08]
MSIDGFITCLTLLVGLYTIASPVAKLRFRLLGWKLWAPSAVFLGAITYFLLFDRVAPNCNSSVCSGFEIKPSSRLSNEIAFGLTMLWLSFLGALYSSRKISIRNYRLFRDLVERLISDRKYGEVVELIEPHFDAIALRANRGHWMQRTIDAVRHHGKRSPELEYLFAQHESSVTSAKLRGRVWEAIKGAMLSCAQPFITAFPDEDIKQKNARQIIRRLMSNDEFVRFVAQERTRFALRILESDLSDSYEFSDRAFTFFISGIDAPLRQEIWENDSLGLCFYDIDSDNQIIAYLFTDSKKAEEREVYRPIGEFAFDSLEDEKYLRLLNSKPRDFDKMKRSDDLFLVIQFFDIMIRSSARDGIEWHMWLYYMNILTRRLVEIIDTDHPDYDENSEFPNFAHFLIYKIVSNLRDWIRLFECLQADSPALIIDSPAATHENGHIIKSAILSVGICIRELLSSDKISDRFIAYVLEIVLRARRDAQQHDNGALVAEALTNSIVEGGPMGFGDMQGHRLLVCFHEMDHVAQYEHRDLGQILEERYA